MKRFFVAVFKISLSTFNELLSLIKPDEIIQWDNGKYTDTLSGMAGITINTIHQAKGLECEVVILNQINVGRIPYQVWDDYNRKYIPLTEQSIKECEYTSPSLSML